MIQASRRSHGPLCVDNHTKLHVPHTVTHTVTMADQVHAPAFVSAPPAPPLHHPHASASVAILPFHRGVMPFGPRDTHGALPCPSTRPRAPHTFPRNHAMPCIPLPCPLLPWVLSPVRLSSHVRFYACRDELLRSSLTPTAIPCFPEALTSCGMTTTRACNSDERPMCCVALLCGRCCVPMLPSLLHPPCHRQSLFATSTN